ncbi:MAG: hypothetical protein FWE08_01280 [Oscillospiraceae bacterium]|nr:hypothetical protein [Oscillospiraceae bacterium]
MWHMDSDTGRILPCNAESLKDCRYKAKYHYPSYSEALAAQDEMFGKQFAKQANDPHYNITPNSYSQYAYLEELEQDKAMEIVETTDDTGIIIDILNRKLFFSNDGRFIKAAIRNQHFPKDYLQSYCDFVDDYQVEFIADIYCSGLLTAEQKEQMIQNTENETLKKWLMKEQENDDDIEDTKEDDVFKPLPDSFRDLRKEKDDSFKPLPNSFREWK